MYLYIFFAIASLIVALFSLIGMIIAAIDWNWWWTALWVFIAASMGTLFAACINHI